MPSTKTIWIFRCVVCFYIQFPVSRSINVYCICLFMFLFLVNIFMKEGQIYFWIVRQLAGIEHNHKHHPIYKHRTIIGWICLQKHSSYESWNVLHWKSYIWLSADDKEKKVRKSPEIRSIIQFFYFLFMLPVLIMTILFRTDYRFQYHFRDHRSEIQSQEIKKFACFLFVL